MPLFPHCLNHSPNGFMSCKREDAFLDKNNLLQYTELNKNTEFWIIGDGGRNMRKNVRKEKK